MKLAEIGTNRRITLSVHLGERELEFKTTTRQVRQGGLVVDAIRVNGKIVGLSGKHLKINVIFDRGTGKPIVWTDCVVRQMVIRNTTYNYITCTKDAAILNRRTNRRVRVGIACSIRGINAVKPFKGNVYDVSATGFAFITSRDIPNYEGYTVRVKFADLEMKSEFDLKGYIVRREEVGENLYLYGCRLSTKLLALSQYVRAKESGKA